MGMKRLSSPLHFGGEGRLHAVVRFPHPVKLALKLPSQGEMEVVLAVVLLGTPRDNTRGKTISTSLP